MATEAWLLGTSIASGILKLVAERCPNLRSLEFYPELAAVNDGSSTESIQSHPFLSLCDLRNLRYLSSTLAVIHSPALEFIGQLPNLSELYVRPRERLYQPLLTWDSSRCKQLPANAFPALQTLRIQLDRSLDVKRFWELVPLAGLKNVYISLESPSDDEFQFIPVLCEGSPRITTLELCLPEQDDLHVMPSDTFEYLARLPLGGSFLVNLVLLDFDRAWVRIGAAWPNLKRISCLYQRIGLQDLLMLSSGLPNLEYIACDLNVEWVLALVIGRNWRPAG
ncbi:hypothetical protein FRC07_003555 [Ceratobasidium sp. 392]|nr:hypothetical protein FRC07_003555 [Ceratobasidium sp. 392]